MKISKSAKNISQSLLDPLETLNSQMAKPIMEEIGKQLGFSNKSESLKSNHNLSREIATDELKRARNELTLNQKSENDNQNSQEAAQKIFMNIQESYQRERSNVTKQQTEFQVEVTELQNEISKLANVVQVKTKAHVLTNSKKIGVLDIKLLRWIVELLRVKAEESKSAKDLIVQRSNAKRATGMLAWVSGKQMKVHEQGTLQLQG